MTDPVDGRVALSTERLELVPLLRSHAESLFPVLSDPALYTFTLGTPPVSPSALHDRYEFLEFGKSPDGTQAWLNWVLQVSGESIGFVQATVTGSEADVAWVVGSRWQGQGYATEATRAMVAWLRSVGVRAVHAKIHPGHSASQGVAAKVGLSRTTEVVDGEEVWTLAADRPV